MAVFARAGIDFGPYLRTSDSVERMVYAAVGERAQQMRNSEYDVLAHNIGASVGPIVGRALGQALQAIARAMRRR
jgi:hypothetical protein